MTRTVPSTALHDYDAHRLAKHLLLSDGVGFMARVLSGKASALYEELTAQSEVTAQQFGVLLTLYQNGTQSLTDLTRATCADRSTIGEMARRMAARGLIARVPGEKDRRTAQVTITSAGTDTLLRIVVKARQMQELLLEPVPAEHRQTFIDCLRRIIEA